MFIAFERLDFHSKINHNKIGASLCKSKLSVCDESLFSFSNERKYLRQILNKKHGLGFMGVVV